MMFQYTVVNQHVGWPAPVIIRTKERSQAIGWIHYRVTPRCVDRARYGLRALRSRAAMAVQCDAFGPALYIDKAGPVTFTRSGLVAVRP